MMNILKVLLGLLCFPLMMEAQTILNQDSQEPYNRWKTEADSTEKEGVPIGYSVWKIDERFGVIRSATPDTLSFMFMNEAFSTGKYGSYNNTGTLGSPRQSRIFLERTTGFNHNNFIFSQPYDYFLTPIKDFYFTNTKSPFTNLTYHSAGNRNNGEDRFRALFATNVNRRLGIGFKVDYLYGRGAFASQANSQFNITFYGSYLGEKYEMHTLYSNNRIKNSENGGIENDAYITSPENFSTSYATSDIPTNLSKTYNKMHFNTLYFTQRYKFGFRRYYDSKGNIVRHRTQQEGGSKLFKGILNTDTSADSTLAHNDTTKSEETYLRPEFVPVAGLVHTLKLDQSNRQFISNLAKDNYFKDFIFEGDSANDRTRYLALENTFALEVHEGFSRWVKTGLRLFARHHLERFQLSNSNKSWESYTENYISLGAQLFKEKGNFFHYRTIAEMRTSGSDWGEFNIEGSADFNLPLRQDTLQLVAFGHIRNQVPSFYYRHYHARNAWWDNTSLDKIFSSRIGGTLSYQGYKATFAVENIKNYTYFQETKATTSTAGKYLYGVTTAQEAGNIQLLTLSIAKQLQLGIFHWNTELTYQMTSNKEVLPLPILNVYSNLFIRFRVAKVLATEFGGDVRFFTKYNAPTYSPIIGQYANQDYNTQTKVGNYPIINLYANFHLKKTRFYVMLSHLNYSKGAGYPFLVAHYPLAGMTFRFGVSWNFNN